MSKLREYKSMIASVILTTFISLHCSWTFIRCSEGHSNEIKNQKEINNKNDIDDIINDMKDNHTWAIFKIIITPGEGGRKKDYLIIENIVSKGYINNEGFLAKLFNRKHNAFLLSEEAAQTIKGTMGMNNNENNNISNENININNENDNINNAIPNNEKSKDNKKSTYYVLVKNINTKKYKNDYYITLFSSLETTARDTNFTYTVEIFAANTTGVEDMNHMFSSCGALTEIVGLDKLDTSNVTNMSYIFAWCAKLTNLHNISSWVTSSVKNMSYMFVDCRALTNLPDISSWDTSNVTNMRGMFWGCESLVSLPDISNWDTRNVTDMSFMFDGCGSLTNLPDISNWITSNVTDMSYMFYNCKSLESLPEISKWETSNVTDTDWMFDGCTNLKIKPTLDKK